LFFSRRRRRRDFARRAALINAAPHEASMLLVQKILSFHFVT
jgi:hypothetical protein